MKYFLFFIKYVFKKALLIKYFKFTAILILVTKNSEKQNKSNLPLIALLYLTILTYQNNTSRESEFLMFTHSIKYHRQEF